MRKDRDDLEKEIYELDAPIKLLVVDLETGGLPTTPTREPERLKAAKVKTLGHTPQELRYNKIKFVHDWKATKDQYTIAHDLMVKFDLPKLPTQSCISKYGGVFLSFGAEAFNRVPSLLLEQGRTVLWPRVFLHPRPRKVRL